METTPEPQEKPAAIDLRGCLISITATGICGFLFVVAACGEIGSSYSYVYRGGDPDRIIRIGLIVTPAVFVISMVITFLLAWQRARNSGKD